MQFDQEEITEGSVEPIFRKKNGKIMSAFNGGILSDTGLISAGMSWALPEKVEYRWRDEFDFFPGTRLS